MTEPAGTALATPDPAAPTTVTEQRIANLAWGHDPDRDFQKLALEANYFSKGFRLVNKAVLVGVPHVIIGITYRPGYTGQDGAPGDYVSIEAVVADKATLESSPIRHQLPHDLEVWGNESVVYNDGGTGVRRELTALLHSIGVIDVGDMVGNGNVFDKPFQMWASGAELAQDGVVADAQGTPFRFIAARGLRRSDYESPYGPATTYYIG